MWRAKSQDSIHQPHSRERRAKVDSNQHLPAYQASALPPGQTWLTLTLHTCHALSFFYSTLDKNHFVFGGFLNASSLYCATCFILQCPNKCTPVVFMFIQRMSVFSQLFVVLLLTLTLVPQFVLWKCTADCIPKNGFDRLPGQIKIYIKKKLG